MRFPPPDPADRIVLRKVLDRAAASGTAGVAVFDLDSTLLDNRPRQARILREFGAARGIAALEGCGPEHWDSGWDLAGAMRATGLSAAEVEALLADSNAFWADRFFTGAYCVEDRAIAGAPAFVRALWEAGVHVAYCTGRPEPMRAGTVESLRRHGFPVPGGERAELLMKPTPGMDDDAFKRIAHERLRALGEVIAAFDNEPTHINDYRRTFPDAIVVHLATDHSGRAAQVEAGIPALTDFRLD